MPGDWLVPRKWKRAAALAIAVCCTGASAHTDDHADQYLGRWDLTLHTPARDYSSWLDVQRVNSQGRVLMVGRWGHARWLPQASIANGRIRFVSLRKEEGLAKGDLIGRFWRSNAEIV